MYSIVLCKKLDNGTCKSVCVRLDILGIFSSVNDFIKNLLRSSMWGKNKDGRD